MYTPKTFTEGYIALGLLVTFLLFLVVGWPMNLWALIHSTIEPTGIIVVRVIGVFVPFIGAFMGIFF